MNTDFELDKRVSVLEKSMEWAHGSIQKIDRNLEIIKNSQFQLIEKLMEYKSDIDERMFSLQVSTVERISSLQAHTDERISSLQAHTDEKFIAVQTEIAGIHKAISLQTKWLLSVILAAATLTSVLHPIMLKFIN